MISLSTTIVLLILAATVNSASVYAQKRFNYYNRFGKNGFFVHSLVISPIWLLFLYCSARIPLNTFIESNELKFLGILGIIISLLVFTIAIRQLGSQALANGIFFGKSKLTHSGIYQYLSDPIYDSYVLTAISVGIITGNANYFPIAAVLWLMLKIESFIESPA